MPPGFIARRIQIRVQRGHCLGMKAGSPPLDIYQGRALGVSVSAALDALAPATTAIVDIKRRGETARAVEKVPGDLLAIERLVAMHAPPSSTDVVAQRMFGVAGAVWHGRARGPVRDDTSVNSLAPPHRDGERFVSKGLVGDRINLQAPIGDQELWGGQWCLGKDYLPTTSSNECVVESVAHAVGVPLDLASRSLVVDLRSVVSDGWSCKN